MEVIFIAAIIVVTLFVFSIKRGTKAVKAYVYLAARSEGASEVEANNISSRLDTHSASQLNKAMLEFTKHCYGGKQLAMISYARLDGFKE